MFLLSSANWGSSGHSEDLIILEAEGVSPSRGGPSKETMELTFSLCVAAAQT